MRDKMDNEIKIEIDTDKKAIKNIKIPKELDPIETVSILLEVQKAILLKIKILPKEPENKIIKPKIKIVGA